MNVQFQNLYDCYLTGRNLNLDRFTNEYFNFFNQNLDMHALHDSYFNNFTIIWQFLLLQGSFFYAEQLWQIVIEKIVKVWENKDRNKEIHKGSAYYFWAITCILKEDFEKGFLLMHKALEDKLYSSNIRLHQLMHVLLLTMNKMNNTFVPKY